MKKQIQQISIPKIEQIGRRWNAFAPLYSKFDATMQTFYYTLINMLQISQASNILQVACGTGKLLSHAINMKSKECKYLASDLSQQMVELTKENLKKFIFKMGVKQQIDEWMKTQNISIKVANGQQIGSINEFDRIICNLVLMITENPQKMLKSLYDSAKDGCLLGVTIWGNKQLSNLLTLSTEAMQYLNIPQSKVRSNFHLYNNLQKLIKNTDWQIVSIWEQNAPFNYYQIDQSLTQLVNHWSSYNTEISKYGFQKIKQTFSKKEILNFPVQLAILRKSCLPNCN